jgi:small multidrug resistance pump
VALTYLLLVLAIAAEVTATSLLPRTAGFTQLWPTLGVLASYGLSFFLLAQVVKNLPIGIAYAIWAGLGTLFVLGIGVFLLHQSLTGWQFGGVLLVVIGVVVINLGGGTVH